MMFTSGTQARDGRTVNHDPEPYLDTCCGTHSKYDNDWLIHDYVYAPRTEFAVHDNSILAAFRSGSVKPFGHTNWDADMWLWGLTAFSAFGGYRQWEREDHPFRAIIDATDAEREHASRVLQKLAAIGGGADV